MGNCPFPLCESLQEFAVPVVVASTFLVLLVLGVYWGALVGRRQQPRRHGVVLALEALEDRLVPSLTMHAVKARIAAEFPEVADPNTSDVVRVGLLRQWAYQVVDLGDGSVYMENKPSIGYASRTLPQLVQLFDRDRGSVMCTGDSWFLMKLYKAYGYTSGRLAVGYQGGSHAVTLVKVRMEDGSHKILIEDPHSNRTPVTSEGDPMGVWAVLQLARQGRADEIFWQEGAYTGRD